MKLIQIVGKSGILFCLVLILIVYISTSFYLVTDDENIKDLFCDSGPISEYTRYILYMPDSGRQFYSANEEFQPPQLIISYLARYEKSPPVLS